MFRPSAKASAWNPRRHLFTRVAGIPPMITSLETDPGTARIMDGCGSLSYRRKRASRRHAGESVPRKKLSNMRSTGDGKGISLSPPLVMTLERSLEYIAPDEYVEVTPKSLRILNASQRKRTEQKIG